MCAWNVPVLISRALVTIIYCQNKILLSLSAVCGQEKRGSEEAEIQQAAQRETVFVDRRKKKHQRWREEQRAADGAARVLLRKRKPCPG